MDLLLYFFIYFFGNHQEKRGKETVAYICYCYNVRMSGVKPTV